MANGGRAQGRKALKTASVIAVDAHACVQRKTSAMFSFVHLFGVWRVNQAALHK